MMAEYIRTNSAKSSCCHQFRDTWTLPSSNRSGRLWVKVCHRTAVTYRRPDAAGVNRREHNPSSPCRSRDEHPESPGCWAVHPSVEANLRQISVSDQLDQMRTQLRHDVAGPSIGR